MSPGLSLPPPVLPEADKKKKKKEAFLNFFSSVDTVLQHIGSEMKL